MEPATQSFTVYSPIIQLNQQSASTTNQLHASGNGSSWHHTHLSAHSTTLTSEQSSSMFSVPDRPPDLEYPSPAPSNASPPYAHHQPGEQYISHHQPSALHLSGSSDAILGQFTQVDSSVGPNRVLTRRQRAALEQGSTGRRTSMPSNFQRPEHAPSPRHASTLYSTSRLQVQDNEETDQLQRDRLSLNITNTTIPMQQQSPSYHPMTPTSMSSPSYSHHIYGHSRSTSGSTSNNHRVASPALSSVSVLTSVSSPAVAGTGTQGFSPYTRPSSHSLPIIDSSKTKQKKQRLDNNARKNICLYQIQHPNARQEDIASVFRVERSTISKILKHKNKWLNMPDNLSGRIAKHRPSKFPEIEEELIKWLEECSSKKIILSDNSIRSKAKETAKMLHISEEKFKASSGWVENFKSRHGIRAGVWSGAGKPSHLTRVLADGVGETILSPLNPAFGGHSEGRRDITAAAPHIDSDLESEDSAEPEEHQTGDQSMTHSPMNIQSPWSEQISGTPSDQNISNSCSSLSSISQTSILQNQQTHHGSRLTSSSSHHHELEHQYVDQHPVFYQAAPPISEPRQLTLADAEDAINTLITFVDSTGQGILEEGERQALNTVKCALFQAASGVPFDRSRQ